MKLTLNNKFIKSAAVGSQFTFSFTYKPYIDMSKFFITEDDRVIKQNASSERENEFQNCIKKMTIYKYVKNTVII